MLNNHSVLWAWHGIASCLPFSSATGSSRREPITGGNYVHRTPDFTGGRAFCHDELDSETWPTVVRGDEDDASDVSDRGVLGGAADHRSATQVEPVEGAHRDARDLEGIPRVGI